MSPSPLRSKGPLSSQDVTWKVAIRLLLAPLLLGVTTSAEAVTRTWVTFGNGAYNNANNWFPAGAPTVNDFVSFEVASGNPYVVTFPGNELTISGGGGGGGAGPASYFSSHLRVRDNGVTFRGSAQINRTNSSYTVASPIETEANRGIIVGVFPGDNASLSISHSGFFGGVLTSVSGVAATIGDAAGANGTLNVNVGALNITGSDFTQKQLIVGNHGSGTLNVNGGADVNVLGSNSTTTLGHHASGVGVVNISGTGSTWTNGNQFFVGESGAGTLTIQNGGSLVTSSNAGFSNIIGVFPGSSGTVNIIGPSSTWTNSNTLTIGNGGDGTLSISAGGALITNAAGFAPTTIGSSGSGAVTVTGQGSTWNTNSAVFVGGTGTASLAILDGGQVTTGSATLRGLNQGTAEVLVGGTGSKWTINGGPLVIGLPEPGFTTGATTLTIAPGGSVSAAGDINIDDEGTLNLQGGTLAANAINMTGGTFNWTSGTLHTSIFDGNLINQAGILAPGQSIGSTNVFGNYTQQAGGTMAIEISHPIDEFNAPERDFVSIDGTATLDGLLQLTLIDGFLPDGDESFAIFSSGTLIGEFSNVANGQRLTTMDGNGSFVVNYGGGSPFNPLQIVLSDFQAVSLPGDYNSDGVVDARDYTVWRNTLGQTGTGLAADGNGTGSIDVGDYSVWKSHFGQTAEGTLLATSGVSIPEPAAAMLLIFAMASGALACRITTNVETQRRRDRQVGPPR